VEAAALAVGALDVRAEDVGVTEEAGEDDAVDEVVSEVVSEADTASELTAVEGVTVPPSTTDGMTSWAFWAADL